MDKIIDYLADNPKYVIALIVTFAVIIIAALFGYFAKKFNIFKINDWFKKKTGDEKSEKPAPITVGDDARMPVKKITTAPQAEEKADAAENGGEESEDKDPAPEDPAEENKGSEPLPDLTESEPTPENADESAFLDAMRMFTESDRGEKEEERPIEKRNEKRGKRPEPIHEEPEEAEDPQPEGKWRIMPVGFTYVAELHSEEDELLLTLPHYSSVGGARGSIETVQKNLSADNFSVAVDKDGKFRFKMYTSSGRLVCRGEPCVTRAECIEKIDLVKRIANRAEIVRG